MCVGIVSKLVMHAFACALYACVLLRVLCVHAHMRMLSFVVSKLLLVSSLCLALGVLLAL